MTPEEKIRQMRNILPVIITHANKWLHNNIHSFLHVKRFPSCFLVDADCSPEGMGKWVLEIIVESKSNLRKHIVTVRAYQTYHVTHSKEQSNNGIGIYELVADDTSDISCHEYTPHYFNRLRERMIEPKGISQPSFKELVRRMTCDHWSSMDETIKGFCFRKDETGRYALIEDHSDDRKENSDNLVSYHPDGISLGVSAAKRKYLLFLTYVPNDMLYPEQIGKQKERLKELLGHRYELRQNPYAKFVRKEWMEK